MHKYSQIVKKNILVKQYSYTTRYKCNNRLSIVQSSSFHSRVIRKRQHSLARLYTYWKEKSRGAALISLPSPAVRANDYKSSARAHVSEKVRNNLDRRRARREGGRNDEERILMGFDERVSICVFFFFFFFLSLE